MHGGRLHGLVCVMGWQRCGECGFIRVERWQCGGGHVGAEWIGKCGVSLKFPKPERIKKERIRWLKI